MRPVIRHGVLFGLLACWWPSSAIADPDALWHIVHDRCVPHQERFQAPFPCLETDEPNGVALLKDLVGQTQTLLIPTARVTGGEDPAVLDPAAPNYFQLAWQRIGMTRALADADLPRDAISLALNSKYGRTQNQLHIHIDCLLPEIRASLAEYADAITRSWTLFPTPLAGHTYLARRVWTLDRPGADPFQLVANDVPGARADMAAVTIVVAGATFEGEPGFIVLAGRADLAAGNRGSGEELQDHRCALAHPH
ncbi:MAG: CDP-diacylglycerol diphosphatase [Acetobacteraceae bacterium]